jgi:hypothetical protein
VRDAKDACLRPEMAVREAGMLNFNSIGRVAVLFAWAAAFRSAAIRTAFCDAGNTIRGGHQ